MAISGLIMVFVSARAHLQQPQGVLRAGDIRRLRTSSAHGRWPYLPYARTGWWRAGGQRGDRYRFGAMPGARERRPPRVQRVMENTRDRGGVECMIRFVHVRGGDGDVAHRLSPAAPRPPSTPAELAEPVRAAGGRLSNLVVIAELPDRPDGGDIPSANGFGHVGNIKPQYRSSSSGPAFNITTMMITVVITNILLIVPYSVLFGWVDR